MVQHHHRWGTNGPHWASRRLDRQPNDRMGRRRRTRSLRSRRKVNPTNDSWLPTAPTGQSVSRRDHTAIWTGTEMIVWGGFDGEVYLNNGGRFNPALNSWTPLTLTGAPEPRALHTAVWSGSQMIVWGGYNGSVINTGGRYNPAANSWALLLPPALPLRVPDTPRCGQIQS